MLCRYSARLALLAFVLALGMSRLGVSQEATNEPPLPPIPEAPSPSDAEYYGIIAEPGCALPYGYVVEPSCGAGHGYGDEFVDEACGCCPAICWTIQADVLFLTRSENTIRPLVNGAAPFGVESFDLNGRFGPRLSVTRHNLFGSGWDGEVSYFGIDGFSRTLASPGATSLATNNAPIAFGARTVTSTYREEIYNTEINFRTQLCNHFTFIHGFRQIEFGSDLFTDLVGASHRVNVNNHLFGYQIGGDLLLLDLGNFNLNTWTKAGMYGNAADQATNMVGIGGVTPDFGAQGTHLSFVGEVGVYGAYRFTNWLTLRAGYQVMWLDGIATASNQIATSDVVTGASAVTFAETLLYHGGFTGIEMYW